MTARPERAQRVEGRVEGRPPWYWCALGAVAMSLGWGLRGSIGGGSLGAMIPGAMIGLVLCLLLDRRSDAGLIAAFAAVGVGFGGTIMVLGTWLAWKYVNSPKLIYFSNLLDRPREELWAGLWLGGLLLVAWLRSPVPAWFALHGAIGGGIGFGVGASLQPMGKAVWAGMPLGWWKVEGDGADVRRNPGVAYVLCPWWSRGAGNVRFRSSK